MIAKIRQAVCAASQCFYCKRWFSTDRELMEHLNNCGY